MDFKILSCKYPFFPLMGFNKVKTLPCVVFWCFLEFLLLLKAVRAIFLSTVCCVLREGQGRKANFEKPTDTS